MSHQISAELFKLRSTRTGIALIASALGLIVLVAALATLLGDYEGADPPGRDLLGISGFATLFALVLGILAVTTELRHGTITPTLVVAPGRTRVIAAKLLAHLLAGLALGAAAIGLCAAIVLAGLDARGIESGLESGDLPAILVGQTLAVALWAVLGVGLGALVGNQVGAIVGALAYTLLVESVVTAIFGSDSVVQKYSFGGLTTALGDLATAGGGEYLGQAAAGLVLLGYAAAFVVAGALVLRRRDVTS
jgi:ABC-2 type transport system permease protein